MEDSLGLFMFITTSKFKGRKNKWYLLHLYSLMFVLIVHTHKKTIDRYVKCIAAMSDIYYSIHFAIINIYLARKG